MFSPVKTQQQFHEAITHIVKQAQGLSETLVGTKLAVETVKVFAHYPDEFEYLKGLLQQLGEIDAIGRSTSLYAKTDITVLGQQLTHVGIRVPDPYRMQTGCVDFRAEDPTPFLELIDDNKFGFVRRFPDMPEAFIELWHPDYDVAGYIPLD